mgnify:CR=1 FL=1
MSRYQNKDKIKLIRFFADTKLAHIADELGLNVYAIKEKVRLVQPTTVKEKMLPVLFKRLDAIMPILIKLDFEMASLLPFAIQKGLDVRKYVPDATFQHYQKPDFASRKTPKTTKLYYRNQNRVLLRMVASTKLAEIAKLLDIQRETISTFKDDKEFHDRYLPIMFQLYTKIFMVAIDVGYDITPYLEAAIEKGLDIEKHITRHRWYCLKEGKPNVSVATDFLTLPDYKVLRFEGGKFGRYSERYHQFVVEKGITHFSEIPRL